MRKVVNEQGRIWKEEVMACLKYYRHLIGGTEKLWMTSQES
jgi:hypothetical protein